MTHVPFESKLLSFVRSSMHPCPGNCVAIGNAVVYYDQAARAFSAGLICRHCTLICYEPLFDSETTDPDGTCLKSLGIKHQ